MKFLFILFNFIFISCSLLQDNRRSDGVQNVPAPHQIKQDDIVKKRILVLPFLDEDPSRSEDIKKMARQYLIKKLNQSGKVYVLSLNDLPQDINNYLKEGEYDIAAISNMARSLDVAIIIEGRIIEVLARKVGDQVGLIRDVNAKMQATTHIKAYSARNSNVLVDQKRTAVAEAKVRVFAKEDMNARALQEQPHLTQSALIKTIDDSLLPLLRAIDKISWEGRVALVKGDRIYINAGKLSGIQLGDILRVSQNGEEIFDPESGRFIGMAPGRTKGTIEVIHYFGKDGSVAIIHSGGSFRENDKVELYY